MEGRGYGGGGRGRVYTHRYTVTTRMTCIKMSSNESHFNVSLIVRDKVIRRERRAEAVSNRGPSAYQPTVLPLGQTGSLVSVDVKHHVYFKRRSYLHPERNGQASMTTLPQPNKRNTEGLQLPW